MSVMNATLSSTKMDHKHGRKTFIRWSSLPTELKIFTRWSSLPTELKIMVLTHRLQVSALTFKTHQSHSIRALFPLLLANKDMYKLCMEVWCTINQFKLVHSTETSIWRYPKAPMASQIRRLALDLGIPCTLRWANSLKQCYCCLSNTWRFLIAPRDLGPWTAHKYEGIKAEDMAWQLTMPSLQDLEISLDMAFDPSVAISQRKFVPCLDGEQDIDAFFCGAVVKLQPKRVSVAVEGLRCGSYSTDRGHGQEEVCEHGCAEKIVKGGRKYRQVEIMSLISTLLNGFM